MYKNFGMICASSHGRYIMMHFEDFFSESHLSSLPADYYNAPLLAQTTYKIFYRAFIDDNTFTSTDWIEFKTKQESGLSGGAIAGILIACHILIALVACAYVFYKKRKSTKEEIPTSAGIITNIGIKGEFHSMGESRF